MPNGKEYNLGKIIGQLTTSIDDFKKSVEKDFKSQGDLIGRINRRTHGMITDIEELKSKHSNQEAVNNFIDKSWSKRIMLIGGVSGLISIIGGAIALVTKII